MSSGAAAYGKPVRLIQGDSHVLVIDQPLRDKDAKVLPNVTRLQVMGENIVNAVQVMVDPASPAVFGFKPLLGPDSASK